MDKKRADGHRVHFSKIVGSTPMLLCGTDSRWAVVIINESSTDMVHVGYSGTVGTIGAGIGAGQSLTDTFSVDEYWAVYASGKSGTVSGFIVP